MKLGVLALLALLQPLPGQTLRVSAAASLAEVLQEIDAAFTQKTGVRVQLNAGASGLLARQIEEGAPVDIFFPADEAKMEALAQRGLIAPATREAQLSNTLVVVVPVDSQWAPASLKDLAALPDGKIAIGNPAVVPAGTYAREHLRQLGLWDAMERKLIPMDNVRAALAAVEAGNVAAGIVYKTDAAVSAKVKIACEVAAAEGPRIVYPMAALEAAPHPREARDYLEFLDSPGAHAIFVKAGFIVLPEAPP